MHLFLFTVGSCLLTVELLCFQLCLGAFLLTIGVFLSYSWSFLLAVGGFWLTIGECV